jgi:hypothetical protein
MGEDIQASQFQSHLGAHSDPALDPLVAHPARVYNVWLGGKDHYAADRDAALRVAGHRPQVVAGARANRQFLGRAVRYLAGKQGISQFLDIGTGLPAPDNTHEVAQALDPAARIVYADNDPLVLAYARALLGSTPGGACDYLDADLHDPAALLAGAARTLDFTRPAAILLLAVLHFLPDADEPAGILATLAAGLAPGSFVAISHLTSDFAPAAVTSGVAAYNEAVPGGITARSHAQVSAGGPPPTADADPRPGSARRHASEPGPGGPGRGNAADADPHRAADRRGAHRGPQRHPRDPRHHGPAAPARRPRHHDHH